jgi:hypothetical protein
VDADPALHSSDKRLLKEVGEPLGRNLPVVRIQQFLPGSLDLARHACNGSWPDDAHLESSGSAGMNSDTLSGIGESADSGTGMNRLYYGDNFTVLRGVFDDESIDLIYLDPPFNSQATYNVLFRSTAGEQSRAQIQAFEDTWHWGDEAELAFDGVMTSGNSDAAELLRAMRVFLKENDVMAYLCMMGIRLIELHRVLKPAGGITYTATQPRVTI